ncbi:very short patch repair endonuclease [Pseudomonas citronellolis]|uniref:very short patch repair endonuclease n=1 Tax=Pseudomonas citronellolis TaxID=53408 RepID=UPI0021BE5C5A|nr:DNA mismatch endonuclease Vsr [Pseudomonas citronellolis]UXJ50814.1 DNA mismatch endonuclease Vsr [Pseudomonas citronellolis]
MDRLTEAQRQLCMRHNKSKNTRPELTVRSICHAMGLRFRLHNKKLPGTPDLTLRKYNACIFVHGCFWHAHENCKLSSTPKTRKEYWLDKLSKNVERDKNNISKLIQLGWRVIVIWECETKNPENLKKIIYEKVLKNTSKN